MQLSKLKTAIRKFVGPIRVFVKTPAGAIIVNVEKTSMIEQLDALHDGDKKSETGVVLRDDGYLSIYPEQEADDATAAHFRKMEAALSDADDGPELVPASLDDLF